ncbi:MAG: sulfatase-like hydrolase/transferase, partial [Pirellulales bacterium]|nr:sulfatase-like hydrolase/transferase [Pirellulales bacterium]
MSLSLGPSLSLYAQSHGHPNILILLADDLGWNDVGYHGSQIKTPHIDRLADGGVVLAQHYVPPMCSTPRAAKASAERRNGTRSSLRASKRRGFAAPASGEGGGSSSKKLVRPP